MSRILAIDYGKKRTGIAVTDPGRIIATGLTTIETTKLVWFLKDYFANETVAEIVIGHPKNLDNSDTDITQKVEKVYRQFQKLFADKKIILLDERFTSKLALQSMITAGFKKKTRQKKASLDQISATILLQDYLQQVRGPAT